ncbi:MAG: N-acetyltransferase [Chloroflexia bacterium]|nr:N-acetyltransferase [Chloroflexia bacterium]
MPREFRVYFRALELDDYKTSVQWRRDDAMWESVVGRRYFVSEEYERQWVQRRVAGIPNSETFAVCLCENDEYIGNGYLTDIDLFNRSCTSGRLIGVPQHRGKGLGFEITLLLLRHAFLELGLERVASRQLTANLASIKSIEKAGYRHEGVARRAVMKNGKLVDLNLMACLREDFLARWDEFS